MLPDQPITSFRDDVIPCYDDVIPECYATGMPYIRTFKTSAKQTSRETGDKQESQEQARKLRIREPVGEDRTGGRGKNEARGHTLQELDYRQ